MHVQSESFDIDINSNGYEPSYFELLFVQDIEILLLEILNIIILFLNFFTKWNFSNMERIII